MPMAALAFDAECLLPCAMHPAGSSEASPFLVEVPVPQARGHDVVVGVVRQVAGRHPIGVC